MLIQNEAKCLKCGDIVFSAHRHDFKSCSCGATSVDGGMAYVRRVGKPEDREERSMTMSQDALNACIQAVEWGRETGRNDLGIALAVIRALRDNNLLDDDKFR